MSQRHPPADFPFRDGSVTDQRVFEFAKYVIDTAVEAGCDWREPTYIHVTLGVRFSGIRMGIQYSASRKQASYGVAPIYTASRRHVGSYLAFNLVKITTKGEDSKPSLLFVLEISPMSPTELML